MSALLPTAPHRMVRSARAGVLYALLSVLVVFMLMPFVLVFFGGFKSQAEFVSNPGGWLPESFGNVGNYVALFVDQNFGQYMVNSLIVAAIALATNIIFSAMAGYALAKLRFRGRGIVFGCVMAAMMVPYVAVFVPQFLVASRLGLINTLVGIAAPFLVMPLNVFIMRQFASGVPDELLEAARLDGASEAGIFFRIFLPLLGPAMATVAILTFLNSWNFFLWPLLVAQSPSTYTLPVGLALASAGSNTTDYGMLLAGAVVVLLPVLILFLLLQRYFIQGIAATGMR